MTGLLIGYARVSTDEQDLTAQLEALAALGVGAERSEVPDQLRPVDLRETPKLLQLLRREHITSRHPDPLRRPQPSKSDRTLHGRKTGQTVPPSPRHTPSTTPAR